MNRIPTTLASLTFLLLALLALLALGCTPVRGGSTDDDDDAEGDDDEVQDDDDIQDDDDVQDDDDAGDDDAGDDDAGTDFEFDGLSFTLEAEVTPGAGGNYAIQGTFLFTYWEDIANGVQNCVQRIEFEGSAQYGPGVVGSGCTSCNGLIVVDESTIFDASNPAAEPDDCDPAELADAEADWGTAFLTSYTNGGFGDFLNLALIHIQTFIDLGLTADVAGELTGDALQTQWADYALEPTHVAYINALEGSVGAQSGIEVVAAPAQSGSTWYSYFTIVKDPSTNTHTGVDMNGNYLGQAYWIITFTSEE